jgi:hypothetical protein
LPTFKSEAPLLHLFHGIIGLLAGHRDTLESLTAHNLCGNESPSYLWLSELHFTSYAAAKDLTSFSKLRNIAFDQYALIRDRGKDFALESLPKGAIEDKAYIYPPTTESIILKNASHYGIPANPNTILDELKRRREKRLHSPLHRIEVETNHFDQQKRQQFIKDFKRWGLESEFVPVEEFKVETAGGRHDIVSSDDYSDFAHHVAFEMGLI